MDDFEIQYIIISLNLNLNMDGGMGWDCNLLDWMESEVAVLTNFIHPDQQVSV